MILANAPAANVSRCTLLQRDVANSGEKRMTYAGKKARCGGGWPVASNRDGLFCAQSPHERANPQ